MRTWALTALAALAWLAGSALQMQQAALPARWLPLLLAASAALAAAVAWRPRARWLVVPAAVALAFAVTDWRAAARLADALDPALEGRDLVVTGVVVSLPQPGAFGTRFVLQTESARDGDRDVRVPQRLSIGWYAGTDADGAAPDIRAGQRWRFTLRLARPHGTLNPHGFDLELWLFEQRIAASGSVRSRPGAGAELLADGAGATVQRLRQRVRDRIAARVPDPTAAGVLAALAVGDQAAIHRDDWDLFRATGVAHLMSISGLHVTMFAWLAGAAVALVWRRSPRLMLLLPAQTAGRCGGFAAAFGYALVAGFGVPAQRTLWMIAAVVLLQSAGVRWPLAAVLLAAAVLVTALDPWALLQPGFWLSFVAVALLAHADAARSQQPVADSLRARVLAALRRGLRTQLVATVGLAPLSMVFFQQVSLVGFAANLVAIPVVTLLVTPLALLGSLLPPLWDAAAAIVRLLVALLALLGSAPAAVWTAAAAPWWAAACGLLGGMLLVLPLPWRLRLLGLPLLLPLAAPVVERPPPGRFDTVAADVGQGTAVLVRTARHLLVYDTGPRYGADADAGQRVLLPLLRARGEHRIDLLLLSHRDADHVGGAASLLAGMPVARISSSLVADHPLLARGTPHTRCEAGQSWTWDGVRFDILHPTAAEHAAATRPNAASCVLRVQGDGGSLLLAGDIEAAQEVALLARGIPLASDVLVVPHHGSRTSSTPAFVAAVAPRTAVVQAGYRSRFGHPAPEVVARYAGAGVDVVRSDRCGAWTLPAAGPPVCQRSAARRYWHHP